MTLATAVPYRHAGLLAKMVTTLDVLSGGRAMLGIGAGDYPEEAQGLGLPFPSLGERFALLDETVQACLRMWSGEHGDERPFHGAHMRLERPLNVPQSLSRPHPPILIAGSGEKKTLPLVARYADACNLRPSPEIPRQLELLRRLCEREGRVEGRRAQGAASLARRHGDRDGARLGRGRRSDHADRDHGARGHHRRGGARFRSRGLRRLDGPTEGEPGHPDQVSRPYPYRWRFCGGEQGPAGQAAWS
jgi:alkanesulfonate monooxygenase SsuD/methylene tetrahydromethanopterin reductase-like flavin-dependent oxidoreductase (luciferase family)